MTKGKQLTTEEIAQIMAMMAKNNNLSATSRDLGIPISTVRKIYDENKDDEQYKQLKEDVKVRFSNQAAEIINKGMILLDKRLTTAIERQEQLEKMIEKIATEEDLESKEKTALFRKINKLQLNNLSEITTAIGTIYDKQERANGEDYLTNVKVTIVDDL